MQSATAFGIGPVGTGAAFRRRPPALPGAAALRRGTGSRPTADSACRRSAQAWLAPQRGPAALPAQRWALIAASVVTDAVPIFHYLLITGRKRGRRSGARWQIPT